MTGTLLLASPAKATPVVTRPRAYSSPPTSNADRLSTPLVVSSYWRPCPGSSMAISLRTNPIAKTS